MSIVTETGIIPERVDVTEVDNRDQGATWLWIGDDYVEVDPVELISNMIENCYNEDVSFLFNRLNTYLQDIDERFPDIKDDMDTDHIVAFRDYLNNLIESQE